MLAKLLIAALAAASMTTVPSQDYTHPQQRVAVDGARRINLFCMGEGSPTVLFDSGAGDSMWVWHQVQGEVAKIARSCAYDRAGYGFSDPAVRTSDARNTVDDLHRLLNAAHVRTPIVYVGHSIAGLYGALFAATYPKDVAGIVFVDPSFADQWQKMMAPLPAPVRAKMSGMMSQQVALWRTCAAVAGDGPLPKTAPKACTDAGDAPEKLDPILLNALALQYSQKKFFDTGISEYTSFTPSGGKPSADESELDSAQIAFGDKPVVILTHGKSQPFPGVTPAQQAAVDAAWKAGHDVLAAKSTRGANIMVPGAGHYIELDKPAAVVDAVKRVVAEVRAQK